MTTTIAEDIKQKYSAFEKAVEFADNIAIDAEQDWENQQTIFKFKDGSQLLAKYPELKVI